MDDAFSYKNHSNYETEAGLTESSQKISKVIIVKGNEDANSLTTNTINSITEELNSQAVQSITQGCLPKETVIEITCITTPPNSSSAYDLSTNQQQLSAHFTNEISFEEPDKPILRTPTFTDPLSLNKTSIKSLNINDDSTPSSLSKKQNFKSYHFLPISVKPSTSHLTSNSLSPHFNSTNLRSNSLTKDFKIDKTDKQSRSCEVIINDEEIRQINLRCGKYKRPPFSYIQLIQMALNSKPDKKMSLREIYKWTEDKFDFYYNVESKGWKNSIRYNLSLNKKFVREKKLKSGSNSFTSYWTMKTDEESCDKSFAGCNKLQTNSSLPCILPENKQISSTSITKSYSTSLNSYPMTVINFGDSSLTPYVTPKTFQNKTRGINRPRRSKTPVLLLPKPPSTSTSVHNASYSSSTASPLSITTNRLKRLNLDGSSGPVKKLVRIAPKSNLQSFENNNMILHKTEQSILSDQSSINYAHNQFLNLQPTISMSNLGKNLSCDSGIDIDSESSLLNITSSDLLENSDSSLYISGTSNSYSAKPANRKSLRKSKLLARNAPELIETPDYETFDIPKTSSTVSKSNIIIDSVSTKNFVKNSQPTPNASSALDSEWASEAFSAFTRITSTPEKQRASYKSINLVEGLTPLSAISNFSLSAGIENNNDARSQITPEQDTPGSFTKYSQHFNKANCTPTKSLQSTNLVDSSGFDLNPMRLDFSDLSETEGPISTTNDRSPSSHNQSFTKIFNDFNFNNIIDKLQNESIDDIDISCFP